MRGGVSLSIPQLAYNVAKTIFKDPFNTEEIRYELTLLEIHPGLPESWREWTDRQGARLGFPNDIPPELVAGILKYILENLRILNESETDPAFKIPPPQPDKETEAADLAQIFIARQTRRGGRRHMRAGESLTQDELDAQVIEKAASDIREHPERIVSEVRKLIELPTLQTEESAETLEWFRDAVDGLDRTTTVEEAEPYFFNVLSMINALFPNADVPTNEESTRLAQTYLDQRNRGGKRRKTHKKKKSKRRITRKR